jgi:hypothetical protein
MVSSFFPLFNGTITGSTEPIERLAQKGIDSEEDHDSMRDGGLFHDCRDVVAQRPLVGA